MAFESEALRNARATFRQQLAHDDLPAGDVAELIVLKQGTVIHLNGQPFLQLQRARPTAGSVPSSRVVSANHSDRYWDLFNLSGDHSIPLCTLCKSSDNVQVGWRSMFANLPSTLTPHGELRVDLVGARERVYWGGNLVGTRIPAWRDADTERGISSRLVFEAPHSVEDMEAICIIILLPWPLL